MEKAISQTSKAILDFQEKALSSGALNQAPELCRSLRLAAETLSLDKAIAVDQVSDSDCENDQDYIDLAPKGSCPHAVGAAQVDNIPPYLPAKSMSEMNSGTVSALGKMELATPKVVGRRMRDREGVSIPRSGHILLRILLQVQQLIVSSPQISTGNELLLSAFSWPTNSRDPYT
jgi:hypothetical protein